MDKFRIAYNRSTGEEFNQDIFHDTLIKCRGIDGIETMTDRERENYIYISFKTNMFREKQYARNKNRVSLTKDIDVTYNHWTEFMDGRAKLIEYLNKEFDKNAFEQYCEWIIEKKTVKEIENLYQEKGLYYKFRKMQDKILKFYGSDLYQMSDI